MSVAGRSEVLTVEVSDHIAWLTLNRPKARNALNMELKQALAAAIVDLEDDDVVRAVVLTGDGPAFCAGGDVRELDATRGALRSRDRMKWLLGNVFVPLAHLEKPTIAAVNGPAFGAGLSLALACDIVVASSEASFSCAFSKMGLVPDCGALWFLPRALGPGTAKELMFTGRRFGAEEAMRLGLVQRVVAQDALHGEALELATEIARGPAAALGMTKRLLEQTATSTLGDAAELESYAQGVAMSSAEHAEALAAFKAKRAPDFIGV